MFHAVYQRSGNNYISLKNSIDFAIVNVILCQRRLKICYPGMTRKPLSNKMSKAIIIRLNTGVFYVISNWKSCHSPARRICLCGTMKNMQHFVEYTSQHKCVIVIVITRIVLTQQTGVCRPFRNNNNNLTCKQIDTREHHRCKSEIFNYKCNECFVWK